MYAGNVVEQGTLEDVFNHTMHPYTEGLFNSLPNVNDRKSKLKPIPGLMPDPTALPEGCPFHPRCPQVMPLCHEKMPPFFDLGGQRKVACWLHNGGVGCAHVV